MSRSYFISWSAQDTAPTFQYKRAQGAWIFLESGEKILDGISTSFQANLGHSNARLKEALHQQIDDFLILSPKAECELKEKVSRQLLDYLGLEGKIFYTVSGAEAVENALKMARQVKAANKVIARQECYHGASLGALSVTGDWRTKDHLSLSSYTLRMKDHGEDPELKSLRELLESEGHGDVAAIILETISGTNGVSIPSADWFEALQGICEEFSLFLILDEVLCGFERTGKPFAFQHYGLKPDFVTMSKGISAGYVPFGAVYVSEKISKFYDSNVLSCGLTNYAHPLGLKALEAVLQIQQTENFKRHFCELEEAFQRGIADLEKKFSVSESRQLGLLCAIEFRDFSDFNFQDFMNEGVYLYCKGNRIILAPPYVSSVPDMEFLFEAIEKTLQKQV